MNVITEGWVINWANVNGLNRRRNRLYFTNGDYIKLTQADSDEIVETLGDIVQPQSLAGVVGSGSMPYKEAEHVG
ncbi:MAG: hypothetical protein GWN93_06105 [Deltaproteobacteria bacterium]|nr:hypothetical protein [Deltaproteobacteria bacterium]